MFVIRREFSIRPTPNELSFRWGFRKYRINISTSQTRNDKTKELKKARMFFERKAA